MLAISFCLPCELQLTTRIIDKLLDFQDVHELLMWKDWHDVYPSSHCDPIMPYSISEPGHNEGVND